MLHKRVTLATMGAIAVGLTALFFAPSLTVDEGHETLPATVAIDKSGQRTEEKDESSVIPPEADKSENPAEEPKSEALQTYVQMNDIGKERLLSDNISLVPPPVLTPLTEIQIREHLNETTSKVDIENPKVVGTITVPVNEVNIHEETDAGPEDTISASEFIDQFGFGTKPNDYVDLSAADADNNLEEVIVPEGVVPIPVSKPNDEKPDASVEIKDIRYQIIDRNGEKAGFRRMKDNNPDTTQWFLVIEAVDAHGKAIPMPVMSMDTGEVKIVTKWAVQVTEKDFMKFSDEKKNTGKIADTIIGTAPSNKTEPKWSVKLTGNMLTEWE
jgi:hypothetical protein